MTDNRSVCHYCGTVIYRPQDVTADHVIPKCALLLFPELRDDRRNRVKCCVLCNGKKAQIPLSVFLAVRHSSHKLKAAQREWQGIIQILTFSSIPNPELRSRALEAYRPAPYIVLPSAKPRPTLAEVPIMNPPFSKNKPPKRLCYSEDVVRKWDEDRFSTGTASEAS